MCRLHWNKRKLEKQPKLGQHQHPFVIETITKCCPSYVESVIRQWSLWHNFFCFWGSFQLEFSTLLSRQFFIYTAVNAFHKFFFNLSKKCLIIFILNRPVIEIWYYFGPALETVYFSVREKLSRSFSLLSTLYVTNLHSFWSQELLISTTSFLLKFLLIYKTKSNKTKIN